MKLTTIIMAIVIGCICSYATAAFIAWDMNPGNWGGARLVLIPIAMMYAFGICDVIRHVGESSGEE